jgi:hypothetical protein
MHENSLKNLEKRKDYVFTSTNQPANAGRKKQSVGRSSIFKQWLGTKVKTQDVNGVEVTLTIEDAIVIAQAKKAMNGDTAAAIFCLDGKYGKVKEVQHEAETSHNIDYSTCTVEELQLMKQAQELYARKVNEARNSGIEDAEVVE